MKNIPPYMLEKLAAIGVKDPQTSPWHTLPPCTDEQIHLCESVCLCNGTHKRVTSVPVETEGGMKLFIGQCSECHEITWCRWMVKKGRYTGRMTLEPARPIYSPGQGA